MKLKPVSAACLLALTVLAQGAARADDLGGTQLKVSGYGTLAAVMTDDSKRQFIGGVESSKGATNKPDIGQDSRFGLQGVLNFQNNISVTAQAVAYRRLSTTGTVGSDKDFSPAIDWLYAQYEPTPDFNLRLGRMALPTYLLSDSLKVGYAANWLRAPAHLYNSEPFNSVNGAEVNYKHSFGGFNVSAQAMHGMSSAAIYTAGRVIDLETKNLNAFNLTVEHGNWLGRVGVVRTHLPFSGAPNVFLIDAYSSVGLQYDNGELVVMAEASRRNQTKLALLQNQSLQHASYGYLAAGWRFGKVIPMALVSDGNTRSVVPINGVLIKASQHNIAPGLSVRYDVAPNVALKAQVDRYSSADTEMFTPTDPDKHRVDVFSVGMDFVF